MTRALVMASLALAACNNRSTPAEVQANAAWADDGASILVASSARLTRSDNPWYADPGATRWEVVFTETQPDLSAPVELARFSDISTSQGGGILSAPLYWLRIQQKVVAIEYHTAVIYDLSAGIRRELSLPSGVARTLYNLSEIDLRPYAAPISVAPSPDGETVAVHFSAPLLGDDVFGEMYFYHAVAFFDLDGRFITHNALEPWRGGTHQLRRGPPLPTPDFPSIEPPRHNPHGVVASYNVVTFVWAPDSDGVIFLASEWDDGTYLSGEALLVDRETGVATPVTEVPLTGQPAPGGFVNAAGAYLTTFTPEGAPDDAEVRLHPSTGHVPFGTGSSGSIEAVGWTF